MPLPADTVSIRKVDCQLVVNKQSVTIIEYEFDRNSGAIVRVEKVFSMGDIMELFRFMKEL